MSTKRSAVIELDLVMELSIAIITVRHFDDNIRDATLLWWPWDYGVVCKSIEFQIYGHFYM